MREIKYIGRIEKKRNDKEGLFPVWFNSDTKCKYMYGDIRVGEFLCLNCSHCISDNHNRKIVRCLADESLESNKKYRILLTEKVY